MYDATARGVDLIAALHDSTRINAVAVLTDGEDNRSLLSAPELESQLQQRAEDEVDKIRVFTIAYGADGADANKDVLRSIAAASGGKDYAGDPNEIGAVYREISSFF